MTFPDAARAHFASYKISCNEYLRLRLRKVEGFVGKRRHETRGIDFLERVFASLLRLELLFPRNMLITLAPSHVFVLHWIAIRYLGKTEDGNLLFPLPYDVLFMSSGLIFGFFKVTKAYLGNTSHEKNLCVMNDDSQCTLIHAILA